MVPTGTGKMEIPDKWLTVGQIIFGVTMKEHLIVMKDNQIVFAGMRL